MKVDPSVCSSAFVQCRSARPESKSKMRVAIPYKQLLYELPNSNFITLLEELWSARVPWFEPVRILDEELLTRTDYDVVFATRSVGVQEKRFLEHYARHGIKLALWVDDLHRYRFRFFTVAAKVLRQRFEAAEVIFITYKQFFHSFRCFEAYSHKVVHLPWSVPEWISTYSKPWKERVPRVLVSGVDSWQYPVRRSIYRIAQRDPDPRIQILCHPGYIKRKKAGVCGREYYQLLGGICGAAATAGVLRRGLWQQISFAGAKYIEIAGCGCLPFMQPTDDLAEFGFRAGVHYVPIVEGKDLLKEAGILETPEASRIATSAQELVRSRHLHTHRAAVIREELWRRFRKTSTNHAV
jgi:hypothetical protein